MFPNRMPHGNPDPISSSYLRTNSSYTDFLQRSAQSRPSVNTLNFSERGAPLSTSWRREAFNNTPPASDRPLPPPLHFRTEWDNGWRTESRKETTSWRAQPRSDSWVNRNNYNEPPPSQRSIGSFESSRPPHPPPQHFSEPFHLKRSLSPPSHRIDDRSRVNGWRGKSQSNWRKETPKKEPERRKETPEKRKDQQGPPKPNETPNKRPFKEPSPIREKVENLHERTSSPRITSTPKKEITPRKVFENSERQWDSLIEPPLQIAETSAISDKFYSDVPEDPIEKIHSPIRNKILMADERIQPVHPYERGREVQRPVHDKIREREESMSSHHSRSSSLDYSREGSFAENPHWKTKAYREESWTAQYKKRVESQKAEALLRSMEQRKSESSAGPSYELPYLSYEKSRSDVSEMKRPPEPVPYPTYPEGRQRTDSSSSAEDFLDKRSANIVDKIDEYCYVSCIETSRKPYFDSGQFEGRFTPPSASSAQHTREESGPTINPNDYIEEFSDEDWNELGALVNDSSRKRSQPASESTASSSKKPFIVAEPQLAMKASLSNHRPEHYPNPIQEHEYYNPIRESYSDQYRREIPHQPETSVSFFRVEKPSVKSLVAFSNTEYVRKPTHNEIDKQDPSSFHYERNSGYREEYNRQYDHGFK